MRTEQIRRSIGIFVLATLFTVPFAGGQVSFFEPPIYSGSGINFIADFNGDGKPDLLAGDGTLNLGVGDGTFVPGTPVAGLPQAVADFNGDGKPDVLEQGTDTLLVLLGNGDGTFQTPVSSTSGASLMAIGVVDLRGTGTADVVGVFNGTLFVYLGNGDGTFAAGVPYSLGTVPIADVITIGDFNGDHKSDIAISAVENNVPGQEIVLLGNGDGTLQTAKTSTGIYNPAYAVAADFNGDGKLDLAVSAAAYCNGSCTVQASVNLFVGNGDSTFQSPTVVFLGNGPLATADFNGDGKPDLIFQGDPTTAQVYLGNGNGTFSNAASYLLNIPQFNSNPSLSTIALADFNSDGKLDIAVGSAVLLAEGAGNFRGIEMGTVPTYGLAGAFEYSDRSQALGDFNKDGAQDVAAISNQESLASTNSYNVFILTNDGSGLLSLAHTYTLQAPGMAIVAVDLNRDGNLDLVVTGQDTSAPWSYSVLLGNGDGSFQAPVFYQQTGIGGTDVISADFNNDLKPDLAVVAGSQTLAILMGNGDGTFSSPNYLYDAGAGTLSTGDFNADGKVDIAAGGTSATAILFGNGDGSFKAAIPPPNLNGFGTQFTSDVNNDGKVDLLSISGVALGLGDGTFTVVPLSMSQLLGVADFNGDGRPDLLIASVGAVNNQLGTIGILLGNGDGTFSEEDDIPLAPFLPTSTLITDMNVDGRPDIVFTWPSLVPSTVGGVAVLQNTTAAGFELAATALAPNIVIAGNSASSSITSTPTFGFNGPVSLSCSGLPVGASCNFNPPTITNASGGSILTITTTSGTAPGGYPIQIKGTSGLVVASLPGALALIVQSVPTIGLNLAPGATGSANVDAGGTAVFPLQIGDGGWNGTASLTCTGAPTGAVCTVPATEVVSATNPLNFTVKVATTARLNAAVIPPGRQGTTSSTWLWATIFAGIVIFPMSRSKPKPQPRNFLLTLAIVFLLLALPGCGGGNSGTSGNPNGTPAGIYSLTVTASGDGVVTQNLTLTLVVR